MVVSHLSKIKMYQNAQISTFALTPILNFHSMNLGFVFAHTVQTSDGTIQLKSVVRWTGNHKNKVLMPAAF